MNLSRVICAMLIAISVAGLFAELSEAQVQMQPPGWTPKGVEVLRSTASSRTEFTLDHSMLVLASKLDANNGDLRRVIAGVSGVFVHDYRYAKPWVYDADILDSLKAEYRAAGWKQLMNSRDKNGGTDLWVRLENNAISNVAILVAKSSEVDFFVVSGSISPLDLSHLGGHFGIPRIEGGVVVPNPH